MIPVHIVCQPNTHLDPARCSYGALRATYELARCLSRSSIYQPTFYAESITDNFYHGIRCKQEEDLFSDRVENTNNLVIGISRGDCFKKEDFNIVYHHGPHHVLGIEKQQYADLLDLVVCVSRFSRDQQIAYGVPPHKIIVLPNGIDTEVFCIRSLERRPKSFLFAGHIRSYKGVARLLEAFELAIAIDSELELSFCGENLEWASGEEGFEWLSSSGFLDSSYRINWDNVVGVIPNVRYLGEKSSDELAEEYSRHSYLVCASTIPETFGLVSLEGQACGCIPILANHGGYLETIVKGCPRFLFKPWDTQDLKKNLLSASRLTVAPRTRVRISDRARAFKWEATGKKFVDQLAKRIQVPRKIPLSLGDKFRRLLFR